MATSFPSAVRNCSGMVIFILAFSLLIVYKGPCSPLADQSTSPFLPVPTRGAEAAIQLAQNANTWQSDETKLAKREALRFLTFVDAEQYDKACNMDGIAIFQGESGRNKCISNLRSKRASLGKMISRKEVSTEVAQEKMPETSQYVLRISYDTLFESGLISETIITLIPGGVFIYGYEAGPKVIPDTSPAKVKNTTNKLANLARTTSFEFLKLLDNGKYKEACSNYIEGGSVLDILLEQAVGQPPKNEKDKLTNKCTSNLRIKRSKYGNVKSRKLHTIKYTELLPGYIITYDTVFSNTIMTETVSVLVNPVSRDIERIRYKITR